MATQTPLNKLIQEIAKKEGKRKQVPVGNIREIMKIANELLGGKIYAAAEEKWKGVEPVNLEG